MIKQETLQFLDMRLEDFLRKTEEEQKKIIVSAKKKVQIMTKQEHDQNIKTILEELINLELINANERNPLFASNHEAYAVIKEEIEELKLEVNTTKFCLSELWRKIKNNNARKEDFNKIKAYAIASAQEAIQIAAMCDKAIMSEEARDE